MSSSSSPFRSLSMRSFDPFDAVLEKEQHAVNEAYYAADVGSRMRVPKRITLTGAEDDLFSVMAPSGFNRASSFASSEDPTLRSMMTVPDRILVAGQDRHVGERGPPRELVLERTIIPPEVETIRVQTPPRVLTLDEHKFPAADDPPVADQKLDSPELASSDSSRGSVSTLNGIPPLVSKVEVEMNLTNATPSSALKRSTSTNDLQMLHQQLCRLNRRVMDLEAESHQRQQRDTFLGILAAAYIVLKAVNWMRS